VEPRVNGVVLEINYELTPNHTHILQLLQRMCFQNFKSQVIELFTNSTSAAIDTPRCSFSHSQSRITLNIVRLIDLRDVLHLSHEVKAPIHKSGPLTGSGDHYLVDSGRMDGFRYTQVPPNHPSSQTSRGDQHSDSAPCCICGLIFLLFA
jgi:hypothetical protein